MAENISQHFSGLSKNCIKGFLKLFKASKRSGGNLTIAMLEKHATPLLLDDCSQDVPMSYHLWQKIPVGFIFLYLVLFLSTLFTILVYVEEVAFIYENFVGKIRKYKTIWVLGAFPMYSMTALVGVFVPRSGPLVDMVANAFFGTCMYNFGQLMVNYMGGREKMWKTIESSSPPPPSSSPLSPPSSSERVMRLNTPPICCCCVCLPTVNFNRRTYVRLSIMVMQVCLVRPLIMFIAAVMWADGIYVPGDTSMNNGFIYVAIINLVSTMTAVYGLMMTRGALLDELQERFAISGKIACLQLCLLTGVIPNLIISILVTNGVIACSSILTSKSRGEILYHILLVFLMVPLQWMARFFYRRPRDIEGYAKEGFTLQHHPYIQPHKDPLSHSGDVHEQEISPLNTANNNDLHDEVLAHSIV